MRLVFYVPGMGGSDFWYTPTSTVFRFNLPRQKYWFEPYQTFRLGAKQLQLASDGLSPIRDRFQLSPGDPVAYFHQQMIDSLNSLPDTVCVPIGYDWRLALRLSSATVAAAMNAAFETHQQQGGVDSVVVVGHSMGGLIARLCYPAVSDALRSKWTRTYTLGTPHGGSYAAAEALNDVMEGLYLVTGWRVYRLYAPALNFVAGGALEVMARSWPALYSLLPQGHDSEWAGLDPNADLLLTPSFYLNADEAIRRGLDGRALDWGALVANNDTQSPQLICVRGRGFPTTQAVANPGGTEAGFVFDHNGDGDSLVLAERATLPGAVVKDFADTTHHDLLTSADVLTWLTESIQDTQTPSPTGPVLRVGFAGSAPSLTPPRGEIVPFQTDLSFAVDKYGWKERYVFRASNFAEALTIVPQLLPFRVALLGERAVLTSWKLKDLSREGSTRLVRLPRNQGISDRFDLDNSETTDVPWTSLVFRQLLGGDGNPVPQSRAVYLRGLPDGEVSAADFPNRGFTPAFTRQLRRFAEALQQLHFGGMVSLPANSIPWRTALNVQRDPLTGNVLVVHPLSAVGYGDAIRFKGFDRKQFPFLGGQHRVYAVNPWYFTLSTQWPSSQQGFALGVQWRPMSKVFRRQIDASWEVITHRDTGRPTDSPRGRRR